MNEGKYWNLVFCVETLIMICLLLLAFLLCGCNSLGRVVKPQKGGEATFKIADQSSSFLSVKQPENALAPTSTTYERDLIPSVTTNIVRGKGTNGMSEFNTTLQTNWILVRERFNTTFGEHQPDEARTGFVDVQKIAAKARAISPVMYFGLALIGLGFLMGFLRYKYPVVFNFPGTYILYLVLFGLFLSVTPSLMENKAITTTICLSGTIGLIVFGVYAYSKNKTENNNKEKTK